MPVKDFEHTIQFYEHQDQNGDSIWLPLVNVILIGPTSSRVSLSLLFDTGASVTTLNKDLYPILGLHSWNQGQIVRTNTASEAGAAAYRYTTTLELYGKTITCPIHLMSLPHHPLFQGLLGRDTIFNEFGFGFWESTHALHVTEQP